MKKLCIWCLSLLVCLVFLVSCNNESKTNFLPFGSAKLLNAVTAAYQEGETLKAAFTDTGAGLAVWLSYSGSSRRLLYSVFNPSLGAWSRTRVLAVNVGDDAPAVASNGASFMVAFVSGNGFVYAVPWSGGSFGVQQKISIGGGCGDVELGSNRTGYCLVWSQYNGTANTPRAALHDGIAWGYPRELDTNNSENFRVVSNGSGYCATWNSNNRLRTNIYYDSGSGWSWMVASQYADNIAYQENYQVAGNGAYYVVVFQESGRIYARRFDLSAGPPWSVQTLIDNGANTAYVARVAANGTNFCVVFSQTDGTRSNIYANFFNGAWSGPVEIDAGNEAATNPDVAANGSNYCAVWTQNDGTSQRAYANIYTGAWAGATALNSSGTNTSNNAFVSSNGSGFLARWVDYISGNNYRLTASLYSGSWSAPAAIDAAALPHNPPAAGIVPFAAGYGVYYSANPDNLSMTIEANVFMNNAWFGAANLYTQQWKGSCRNNAGPPKILTAGDRTAAIWAQHDKGNTRLFACIKSGATWGLPLLLAENILEFTAAVGGNNICAAYRFNDSAAADPYKVRARIFDGAAGTWSAGEDLEAVQENNGLADIVVAGSGSTRDFCIAWRMYQNPNYYVRAKVHDAAAGWDATPHEINGGANQMDILKLNWPAGLISTASSSIRMSALPQPIRHYTTRMPQPGVRTTRWLTRRPG